MFDLETEGISVEEAVSGRHILEKFLESSVSYVVAETHISVSGRYNKNVRAV